MASLPHSPIASSGTSASDHLQSSCNGINGMPVKYLGRSCLGVGRRDLSTVAMIKKWKKHDYPWPDEIDPNVKGGHLSYLSHFKPLKEKPKPVTLNFEKPLRDLEKKIVGVRKMSDETGLDFTDQISSLETKYQQALEDLYTHLTPIQRLNVARHPNRPTFLDHVLKITDKWVELHGDRAGYDDPAIVTGIGSIDGMNCLFIGHQKGRNTKENIQRNFGMPTPHGYRKALRLMYYADHHGLPIITFIDTPGAFADLRSEELGQGEAIAHNLRAMFGLKVPIVTVVIGEGGSGGALAIGCANRLLMMENAVFFVASPEACAAILWKSSKAAPKAAEKLKITAKELCKLKIADGIIPEPPGGAHTDPSWTSEQIKIALVGALEELLKMDTQQLLHHRMLKFRAMGGFQEGIPADPVKKARMKKKEEPVIQKGEPSTTPDIDLEDEIEKLKQKIFKSKESLSQPPELGLNEMIEKLKREVDLEFSEAVKSMGLMDSFELLRKDVSKARSSPDQLIDPGLKEKIEKLKQEMNQGLSTSPNFPSLNYKLNMLKEISKAKELSEQDGKLASIKREINKRLKEIVDQSNMKERIEILKAEMENSGASTEGDLDQGLKAKIAKVKKEMGFELANVLKSLHLDVELMASKEEVLRTNDLIEKPPFSDLKVKIKEFNNKINVGIQDAVNSTDLKNKIEMLKLEVAKAGKLPDPESMNKIETLKQQIRQSLGAALSSSALIDKHEKLMQEIAQVKGSEELNGALKQELLQEADSKYDLSRVEINRDVSCSFT
ncbi:acetyl-coenzyme A carboxylase carboxyl transferase subunit alpha, chloroplastic-like isoform X1 [Magnolia sinica]|uniref:acetyl-coenzyme A carboxylase carboxyl transferase subunit alpha, chloroplastic-like isoform X1 n=1 Tax=Magnolia sinica TaxID=86752 RepID=UPI00265A5BC7|nr:acetyl-coenzyme A carboxylase carboxyl transferase subunit alpha, chloroplastic-like isoform X1 [Magnolia sinica]